MQALACSRPSALENSRGGRLLGLETSGGATPSGDEAHALAVRMARRAAVSGADASVPAAVSPATASRTTGDE